MQIRTLAVLLAATAALPAQQKPRAPGVINGRVVDTLDDPLPAVEVVVKDGHGKLLRKARADGEGMFVVSRLPVSPNWLTVHATAKGRTADVDYVKLTAARPRSTALLRLWDAGSVHGRVVDAAGKPLAGATVVASFDVSRLFGFEPCAETTTDAEGRFDLQKVCFGSIHVRAFKRGYAMARQTVYVAGEKKGVELQLSKGKGTSVVVSVTGLPDGHANRAKIQLIPYHRGSAQAFPSAWRGGTLKPNGTWQATGLPDLEYLAMPTLAGFTFQPRSVRGDRGKGAHEMKFVARAIAKQVIRGQLVRDDGKPLPQTLVQLRRSSVRDVSATTTDDAGRFAITTTLRTGERGYFTVGNPDWTLTRDLTGRSEMPDPRMISFFYVNVDPDKEVRLEATRACRLAGRVQDPRGRPAPFVTVQLEYFRANHSRRWSTVRRAYADRQGRFAFGGLHELADDLRLRVHSPLGAGVSETFKTKRGKSIDPFVVKLAPPGIVEGVVVDSKGQPIPGARVQLRNWDLVRNRQKDGGVIEVLTDRQGRFRHRGVEPGGHYLDIYVESGRPVAFSGFNTDTFEVQPGKTVKRKIKL